MALPLMQRLLAAFVAVSLLAAAVVLEAAAVAPAPGTRTVGDGVVDAEVLGATAIRRSEGRRAVVVELVTDERISGTVRVIRYRTVLRRSRLFQLRPGRWAISVALPRETARGRARVVVRLEDRGGAVDVFRQPIVIPPI